MAVASAHDCTPDRLSKGTDCRVGLTVERSSAGRNPAKRWQEARGTIADFQAAIMRIFCNRQTRPQAAISEVCHGASGARSRLHERCGKMIKRVQSERNVR